MIRVFIAISLVIFLGCKRESSRHLPGPDASPVDSASNRQESYYTYYHVDDSDENGVSVETTTSRGMINRNDVFGTIRFCALRQGVRQGAVFTSTTGQTFLTIHFFDENIYHWRFDDHMIIITNDKDKTKLELTIPTTLDQQTLPPDAYPREQIPRRE